MNWRKPSKRQFVLGAVIVCLLAVAGLSDRDRQATLAQAATQKRDEAAGGETSDSTTASQQTDKSEKGAAGLADQKNNQQERHASGRVIDAQGKPVAGARLFARVYTSDGTVQRVSETTNAKGEFAIKYPSSGRRYQMYHTWVYAEGHSIRVVNMGHAFLNNSAGDVEIRLPHNAAKKFKVLLPNGEPCVDAVVRPWYISVPNGVFAADEPTGLTTFLPEALKPLFARQTDVDGRVRIDSIPTKLLNSIEVETPKYGRQIFPKTDETLQLFEVGKINGVLLVDSPRKYAGTKVFIRTLQRRAGRPAGKGYVEAKLDETGRFQIPAIVPGAITLSLSWDIDFDVVPVVPQNQTVSSGETLNLMIGTLPTIPVTGRIITSDTREPVVAARISYRLQGQRNLRRMNSVETDEQGRYSIRLPAGKMSRQVFEGVESPYEYPSLVPIEIPADAKEYEVEEILVHPMRLVKGTLLNGTGDPISKTTVVLHTGGSFNHLAGQAETQLDGTFEMRVNRWNHITNTIGKQMYWATLDQPASDGKPPQFTRLTVGDDNPDALMLQWP